MFPCDKCGLCCQAVRRNPIYEELDRGDGTCRYFDDASRLCTIYERRPLLCNIDGFYDKYLSKTMSRTEYYRMNLGVCEALKRETKSK